MIIADCSPRSPNHNHVVQYASSSRGLLRLPIANNAATVGDSNVAAPPSSSSRLWEVVADLGAAR